MYVEKAFPPEAKARALTMINDLKAVLRERLTNIEWMGPETREAALKKLDAFGVKVGYPDKFRDYSALDIKRQPFVLNVLAANAFETKRQLAKIGHPVDKSEWGMTPPTVNAYYNPSRNEIVFPAGILQPPFFSATADDAVNYGGMGAVIGHEMTHGFDDQGRQYDAQGNLKNWWTDGRSQAVQGTLGKSGGAVQRLRAAARPARQRPTHPGREHRRPRRLEDRVLRAGKGACPARGRTPVRKRSMGSLLSNVSF